MYCAHSLIEIAVKLESDFRVLITKARFVLLLFTAVALPGDNSFKHRLHLLTSNSIWRSSDEAVENIGRSFALHISYLQTKEN